MERASGLKPEDVKETRKVKILLAIIAFLLALIVLGTIVFIRSTQPMTKAKKEAIEIAEKSAKLSSIDQFYSFTRKETYFSVTGKDSDGNELAVIIPKSGDKITVLDQSAGVSEGQIRQVIATDYGNPKIQKISLGIYDSQPVWEVVTENSKGLLTYYLLSFERAEEISVINDI